ncbi:hypothetical protein Ancab_014481, partial [Ancistrocladus abbreviatus]
MDMRRLVNSAKVAGGMSPAPLQDTWPEAQSPVAQLNLPEESVEQPVRGQKRPLHDAGASREDWPPEFKVKPVEDIAGEPLAVWTPGHT